MDSTAKTFLAKRLERKVFTGLPLTIFAAVFLILLGTFLGITDSIVNSYPIVKFDNTFAHSLYLIRTPAMAKVFYTITHVADQITIGFLLVISLVYLYFKKELAYLYSLILTFIGTEGSIFLIKIFINRDRPGADIAYYLEGSKSFPSGHSAIAIAFFGFVVYYLMHHFEGRARKYGALFLGIVLIGLIGFSRLYLGVHYMSDVLGGFLLGGLWLVAGITFRERHFYISSLKKGKSAMQI
jgi:undecaprenyl-diphosphatase